MSTTNYTIVYTDSNYSFIDTDVTEATNYSEALIFVIMSQQMDKENIQNINKDWEADTPLPVFIFENKEVNEKNFADLVAEGKDGKDYEIIESWII
jgi:hypothetical protein